MARQTIFAHPKLHRLAHLLGLPRPYALGLLEYIWNVAYQSGNHVLGDALAVELAAEWVGEPGKLAATLVEVRLLDQLEGGRLAIHDFWVHAPNYVGDRAVREQQRQQAKTCGNPNCPRPNKEYHSADP